MDDLLELLLPILTDLDVAGTGNWDDYCRGRSRRGRADWVVAAVSGIVVGGIASFLLDHLPAVSLARLAAALALIPVWTGVVWTLIARMRDASFDNVRSFLLGAFHGIAAVSTWMAVVAAR